MTCRLKRKSWLRWLFRWTTGSPAVLQWWIEYQPFDAHCIRLNISIVNGWRSSLYLVGCLRRFWLMFCAVLSWRSSLHLVLNVPFAPFNSFQSCQPPFVGLLEKVLGWNLAKVIKTYGSCKDEWEMNGSVISCRRFYLRHTPTHLKTVCGFISTNMISWQSM